MERRGHVLRDAGPQSGAEETQRAEGRDADRRTRSTAPPEPLTVRPPHTPCVEGPYEDNKKANTPGDPQSTPSASTHTHTKVTAHQKQVSDMRKAK